MWLSRHRTGQCQKLWPKYLQNEAWALFFPFVATPLACTAPKPSVALDYCGQRHFYLDIAHMQNHVQRPQGEMAAWDLLLSTTFPGQLGPVIFFFFFAMPQGMWDPNFPTRDRTLGPCFGSSEVLTTRLPGKSRSYRFDSSDPARVSWTSLDNEACPRVHLGTQAH